MFLCRFKNAFGHFETLAGLVAGLEGARLKRERPASKPHPSIVVREELADGTEVEAVWAWLPESRRAMLVTVYVPE